MKKLYTILGLTFALVMGGKAVAQTSFDYKIVDTIVYGDTMTLGDLEIDGNYVINLTAAPCTLDVVRAVNVNLPWTSAFCLDVCYADFIDSVRFILAPNDSAPFIPHFYIDAVADSQKICMKIKNVLIPTDVAYQCFYGVTKAGWLGVHEYANLANVSMYPSPVVSGNNFSFNISNVKVASKEISLLVYNIYGSMVQVMDVQSGNNTLNLDLAPGIYSYSLVSGDVNLNSGKFSVTR